MARTQHLKLLAEEKETAYHAVFPEDIDPAAAACDPPPEAPPTLPSREEEAYDGTMIYPEAVYAADAETPPWNDWPESAPDPALMPVDEAEGAAALALAQGTDVSRVKRTENHLWALVALLCAGLLMLLIRAVYTWYTAYAPFRQKVSIVSQDTIAQGVLIDGMHVGGLTRQQAGQALAQSGAQEESSLHMTVRVDGQTWVITPNELPFLRNAASVINTAYAVGRQGSVETIASGVTPFEYRYQHLYHTAGAPVSLYTRVTYNPDQVRHLVRIIESNINRDAVDAQVSTFDFGRRAFTFSEDRSGARLDGEKLYQQIISALNRRDFQAVIEAYSEEITPRVTRAELMNSFSLVSTYATQTTSNANRNTNIDLACRAVNGTVVMPGETFSFNQATGQRTEQKGYRMAAAIAGGSTVDEIGGGVCQVSSTLFNAAAMADMTILKRTPHTWPSNYVEKGRDATVNWPNLDFSFRNDQSNPVFIAAWYEKRKCTVEIYGAVMSGGQSIDLDTQLMDTIPPPEEPIMERNPALEPGTVREKKKARTGYLVDTYKVYKRNGREVKRELLCISDYKMIQQVIEYN